ncbi:hypothetical protein HWV62_24534 [Athelia sp. TMB]|nr:hypothetical protein HWV62_24534 [Athelia sp. TMB]
MLQSRTPIDIQAPANPNIESASNAIYMTREEHDCFRRSESYLDKEAYPATPNKHKLHMVQECSRLSYGKTTADVNFLTLAQSGVELLNPELLKNTLL